MIQPDIINHCRSKRLIEKLLNVKVNSLEEYLGVIENNKDIKPIKDLYDLENQLIPFRDSFVDPEKFLDIRSSKIRKFQELHKNDKSLILSLEFKCSSRIKLFDYHYPIEVIGCDPSKKGEYSYLCRQHYNDSDQLVIYCMTSSDKMLFDFQNVESFNGYDLIEAIKDRSGIDMDLEWVTTYLAKLYVMYDALELA